MEQVLLKRQKSLAVLKARYEKNDPALRTKATRVSYVDKNGDRRGRMMYTIDQAVYRKVCDDLHKVRAFLTKCGVSYC